MRVIKDKRVALTSTSRPDAPRPRPLRRGRPRAGRDLPGGPLRGPRRSGARRQGRAPRPRPLRPGRRRGDRGGGDRARPARRAGRARRRPAHHQQRRRHLLAQRRRRSRSSSRAGSAAATRDSYASLVVSPVADDEGGKKRRGFHYTAKRYLGALDAPEDGGPRGRAPHAAQARRAEGADLRGAGRLRSRRGARDPRPDGGVRERRGPSGASRATSSGARARAWRAISSPSSTTRSSRAAPGSRPFDGEGLAPRRNVVVEQGVLRTYLCDSYSARKLGRASTASASRGGERRRRPLDVELPPPADRAPRRPTSSPRPRAAST